VVMGRPQKYSAELRRRAVDKVLERGRKTAEVAAQLESGRRRRCAAG
jgi:transposase-like protein